MVSHIRPLEEGDLPAVTALYAEVFGEVALKHWQRRFDWQFNKNPANAESPSKMWVATADDAIRGFLAAFPARLHVLGRQRTILHPCDLMVSPEARGERLGERLIREYIGTAGGLANALAYSASAGRLYDRLGYQSVAAEPGYLRPVNGSRLLAALVARRSSGRYGSANRIARAPLSSHLAALAVSTLNSIRAPRAPRGFGIDIDPSFDADFDNLWRTVSRDIPITFVRDANFLQWRFRADPATVHSVFAVRGLDGLLVGYAAVCETSRNALRIGKIMDLFCSPSNAKNVVRAVLPPILDHFDSADVDVISAKGLHPAIRKELRRYLYIREPGAEMPARLLWTDDASTASLIYSAENWHLTYADGDDDFIP